jgi:hypothetical protein
MRVHTVLSERRPHGGTAAGHHRPDGEHLVEELPDGRRLLVTWAGGAAVRWRALDVDGRDVTTVVIREPSGIGGRAPGRWALVCACFAAGDLSWWEPC